MNSSKKEKLRNVNKSCHTNNWGMESNQNESQELDRGNLKKRNSTILENLQEDLLLLTQKSRKETLQI